MRYSYLTAATYSTGDLDEYLIAPPHRCAVTETVAKAFSIACRFHFTTIRKVQEENLYAVVNQTMTGRSPIILVVSKTTKEALSIGAQEIIETEKRTMQKSSKTQKSLSLHSTTTLFTLFVCVCLASAVNASELKKKLAPVNVASVQADVGIGVVDLSSGESWFLNGEQRFPMQSVFKVPIAIAILKLVDDGALSLDQSVTVSPKHYAPGWSPLRDELKGGSGQVTVRRLLERSVADSDNTAVDVLIELAGGTGKVDAILKERGLREVRVDRMERELQTESQGLEVFRPEHAVPEQFAAALAQVPEEKKRAAAQKFLSDPRDTATPEGMSHLLSQLYQHKLLSPSSTQLLLQIMTDTPHGQGRLKAGLPPTWSLAHKTGTGPDVLGVNIGTNDAGLACAPAGKCFAFSVFIAGSKVPLKDREMLMRDVAAAVTQ